MNVFFNKPYFLSNNKKSNASTALLIVLAVAPLTAAFLITKDTENVNIPLIISIYIVSTILLPLIAYFSSNNSYITFTDNGFEISRGVNTEYYSYKEFDGSHITRNYTNGFYTGSTRTIKIKGLSGNNSTIECSAISKKAYSEIVSILQLLKFKKHQASDVPDDYFEESFNFVLPQEELTKSSRNRALLECVAGFVAIVLSAILWVIVGILDTKINGFRLDVLIIAGIMALLCTGGLTSWSITRLKNYRKTKNIPARIVIGDGILSVDNVSFYPINLKEISVTSSQYTILSRDLVIKTLDGKTYNYYFGRSKDSDSKKLSYADYSKLVSTINLWSMVNEVKFAYILG